MSYDAKVFNVMIASPNDMGSERSIIRDITYEWNAVHSTARKIVLLPIGWESHSSPEMGGAPQDIINKQVLEKCDLLVGVFWTRIGTETNEYASGTVEEIEKHIQVGKPTMLYFSSQPVHPDSVDSAQYARLKNFKSSCQNRGLYESYGTLSEFKEKFYRHLQLKVNEHEIFLDISTENHPDNSLVSSAFSYPNLSQEAKILLKEASLDRNGIVMFIRGLNETYLQTNGKQLNQSSERREVARWEAAIEELVRQDLIASTGYKGEIYKISNLGFKIADTIEL